MNFLHTCVRRKTAPKLLSACPRGTPYSTSWREGSAVAAGFLVLLVTAWLIWAALADAASALGQAA